MIAALRGGVSGSDAGSGFNAPCEKGFAALSSAEVVEVGALVLTNDEVLGVSGGVRGVWALLIDDGRTWLGDGEVTFLGGMNTGAFGLMNSAGSDFLDWFALGRLPRELNFT